MPIGPGTKLGQYEVQAYVGQGAMGVVYRAYHAQLARTGAVKVLQALSPDVDSTARFRREAQAIAQMRHPNILNVFDFGEFEGTPYMIVEFVDGGSLLDRLKSGPIDQASAIKFLRGIATGLDHAHSLGIVHRDVKPANVLIGKNDTPILADFGLAKLMQSSSVKSVTGVTTGTPAYMAPEQVTGSQVGPPADIYSLATIAYELLTGVIPFEGEGVLELLYAHVHREPPPPSSRKPELGPRVDAVILRGLAKDPDARWQTGEEFVNELAAALEGTTAASVERTLVMARPTQAPATAPSGALVPAAPIGASAAFAEAAVPPAAEPPRKSHRLRVAIIAAVAIILVAAIAVVAVLAFGQAGPTFALSSGTIQAGDKIVLTASHLPPNQVGEVQLLSPVATYPFRADSQGNVSIEVTVPRSLVPGDHLVKICWSGSCHGQQTLHVTAARAGPPQASPSPSPTHTAAAPVVHASTPVRIGQTITITGANFETDKGASVAIVQGTVTHQLNTAPVTVHADGTFSFTSTVPTAVSVGPAEVVGCTIPGGGVRPTASQCASQPIAIEK